MKLLIFFINFVLIRGDIFTSMADVSKLLTTESEMIRTVESYINAQEMKIQKLKRDLLEMEKVHEMAAKSSDQFLSNPINSYLLIKRLTVDWGDLQTVLQTDSVGQAMIANLTSMTGLLKFPDVEDLNGVTTALMRLQDTYQLDTASIASGDMLGIKTAYRELTASDCFELGRQSYNSGDYYHCVLWMTEALSRYEREDQSEARLTAEEQPLLFDILEYLAFSTYKEGSVHKALQLTERMLMLDANHSRAIGNRNFYQKTIREDEVAKRGDPGSDNGGALLNDSVKKGYTVKEASNPSVSSSKVDSWEAERLAYERLCREGARPLNVPPKRTRGLDCFYQSGPSPWLLVGPMKAEVAHIHPTIVVYHDAVFDKEIEVMKAHAMPRFQRATVQNYETGALETATYRTSKSAWLKDEDDPLVARVNSRIQATTGLTMSTAEELQVANYGIGGHYEPHFDYARKEEKDAFKGLGTGNRIATFLIYMTDVEAGGATVFPRLDLALRPRKGSAAFWHNLLPSGEGDAATRHAACPVVVGQKWVSNKWIHEQGQEISHPCLLRSQDLLDPRRFRQ